MKRKSRVEQIIGMDFSRFSEGTSWTLVEVHRISESLKEQGIRCTSSLLSMSYEALCERIKYFDNNLQNDTIDLQARINKLIKSNSSIDRPPYTYPPVLSSSTCPLVLSSSTCPPVLSPNDPKVTKNLLNRQECWNVKALKAVASTHKFTDKILLCGDHMMLSTTCCLVGKRAFDRYFTTIPRSILLYLSAKITFKYVEDNFKVTEPNERDIIKLCMVHTFGLSQTSSKKRKRGHNSATNSSTDISTDTLSGSATNSPNRSTNRLFFLIPDQILKDLHSQFSFSLECKGQEFFACIGWLISRTIWLRNLYQDILMKKYPIKDLPNPFDNYEKELKEITIANEARTSLIQANNPPLLQTRNSSLPQTGNPSVQQTNSNIIINSFNNL